MYLQKLSKQENKYKSTKNLNSKMKFDNFKSPKNRRADEKPTKKIGLKRSTSVKCQDRKKPCIRYEHKVFLWLREPDLNQRPSGYEPDELPDCSIPRYLILQSFPDRYDIISLLYHIVKYFIKIFFKGGVLFAPHTYLIVILPLNL